MDDQTLIEKYKSAVGRPPRNLPDDHPDRWQWDYRGTKEQRAALAYEVFGEEDQVPVIEGQEELF